MDRFFVGDEPGGMGCEGLRPGSVVRLGGREARHAKVKRLEPGDRVHLFDGRGAEVEAEVVEVGSDGALLEVLGPPASRAAPLVRVTLGVVFPKGKRASLLVEKATELGAAGLFPLVTRRAVGAAREAGEGRLEKWRRTTIEAAKQSGLRDLPDIGAARALDALLAAPPAADLRLILHPGASALPLRDALPRPRPATVLALIGPEGGFTPEEVQGAERAGFTPVRLGPTVLRIETAAIALLASIATAYE